MALPSSIDVSKLSIEDKADKYGGRWLGEIWALQGDGTWLNVNQEMINSGHAVPYNP